MVVVGLEGVIPKGHSVSVTVERSALPHRAWVVVGSGWASAPLQSTQTLVLAIHPAPSVSAVRSARCHLPQSPPPSIRLGGGAFLVPLETRESELSPELNPVACARARVCRCALPAGRSERHPRAVFQRHVWKDPSASSGGWLDPVCALALAWV